MTNFQFYNPVKVIFGAGEMAQLGTEAAAYGKKGLLVKAVGPLEKMGVYSRAKKLLEDAGVEVFELNGVEANPKVSSVYEGIKICKENSIDIVLAVGGGSAIDCAKGIAVGARDAGDVWDFYTTKRTATEALPIGVVSTIAATGAEMSVHSVVTNDETNEKFATHYVFNLPKFAIIDTELQKTVPRHLTACGMVDTISHVSESYFAETTDTGVTDRIAEGVVKTIVDNEGILDDLENITMRNRIAWAATLGINGLTDAGRGAWDYGAHIIEHAVSGLFDVVHGEGLSVIHPAWLYYTAEIRPDKFNAYMSNIFGINGTAEEGIDHLKEKYKSWGMPVTLKEIGVEKDSYDRIAEAVVNDPDSFIKDKEIVFKVLSFCE